MNRYLVFVISSLRVFESSLYQKFDESSPTPRTENVLTTTQGLEPQANSQTQVPLPGLEYTIFQKGVITIVNLPSLNTIGMFLMSCRITAGVAISGFVSSIDQDEWSKSFKRFLFVVERCC